MSFVKKINEKIPGSGLRVFTFFLIIFQSLGIRYFEGQGFILSAIIIFLSNKGFRFFKKSDLPIFFLIVSYLLFNKILNNDSFSFSACIYQISLVISGYVFLLQYRNPLYAGRLLEEFFIALKWFVVHAIVSYIAYLLVPKLFKPIFLNQTLLGIFYVSQSTFGKFQRNTGLAWEPGTMQLIANLFFFLCVKLKKKTSQLVLGCICVITTFSTAGLLLLLLNVFYYFLTNIRRINPFLILMLFCGFVTMVLPIIVANSSEKLNNDNTSGLARQRDILIGIDLIKEKPLLGHGFFDTKYLATKGYASQIEGSLFSDEYLDTSGSFSGGYTNGLLGLFCWYGIPVGLITFWLFYKNKIVGDNKFLERLVFALIFGFSAMSEPITYTSFFLIFPFSYLIFKREKSKVNNKRLAIRKVYYSQP